MPDGALSTHGRSRTNLHLLNRLIIKVLKELAVDLSSINLTIHQRFEGFPVFEAELLVKFFDAAVLRYGITNAPCEDFPRFVAFIGMFFEHVAIGSEFGHDCDLSTPEAEVTKKQNDEGS